MTPLLATATILRDIRLHCRECMGGAGNAAAQCRNEKCRLHKYAVAPVQIDMFDGVLRETWVRDAVRLTVETFPRGVWFSEARERIENVLRGPGHSNWWGGVASGLKAAGWHMSDAHRKSARASRNAAHEKWWGPNV